MTWALVSFVVNVSILFLLAGTIYFTWRLSDQISRFRNNRSEMDRLIRDLNTAITRAQSAMTELKDNTRGSADELDKMIRRAMEISDELQLITETGNNLAERLERLATRETAADKPSAPAAAISRPVSDARPNFSIRDPEFDRNLAPDDQIARAGDDEEWDGVEDLRSQAEKELFKALQKNKKTSRSLM